MASAALIAAATVALLAVVALLVGAQVMRGLIRGYERRLNSVEQTNRELVNRIMYMADKPWDHPVELSPSAPAEEYVPDELDIPLTEWATTEVDWGDVNPAGRV